MLHDRPTRQMGQSFIREAARVQHLNHINVVRLLAVHFRTNPLLMVMEYMSLGDLKSLLRQVKPANGDDSVIGIGVCACEVLIHDSTT